MSAARDGLGARGVEGQKGTDASTDASRVETASDEAACAGAAAVSRTRADTAPCAWSWATQHSQTQTHGALSSSPAASPPHSPPDLGVTYNSPPVTPHVPRVVHTSTIGSDDEEGVNVSDEAAGDSDSEDDALRRDEDLADVGFQHLTIEDDPSTAGAPGWLLQQLQSGSVEHTCKAGFLQMGMDHCGDPSQDSCCIDELPPEGWETRTSRRDGRTYFFNTTTGESRWPRQRRSITDYELAAGRCKACRAEWIALHDGSQHRRAPTAAEAIELAHRRLSSSNNARRTMAYQLLAFCAAAHSRLGKGSVASVLPFDLQEKIGRSLGWHHVGAAATSHFLEQGWAWTATATLSLCGEFSLGSFRQLPSAKRSVFRGRQAKAVAASTLTATGTPAGRRRPAAGRRRQPRRK